MGCSINDRLGKSLRVVSRRNLPEGFYVLDGYNPGLPCYRDYSPTITTRVDAACLVFLLEVYEEDGLSADEVQE